MDISQHHIYHIPFMDNVVDRSPFFYYHIWNTLCRKQIKNHKIKTLHMTLIKTHITLIEKVSSLIKEVDTTHRYSMSRIYGLYNEAFSEAEIPQSCASCLIRKVNQLKIWLTTQSIEENSLISKKTKKSSTKNKKSTKPSK